LGGDEDVTLRPIQFPNQRIYASSASSVDTYFFKKYKEFSKKMFAGDKNYFVADINDQIVMNATYNGLIYPVPLLTQQVIDDAIRENPEKGNREYKNIFSKEGGNGQIVKRATIIRNSEYRAPVLCNDGSRKFVIAYDPARSYDNSVSMIGEIYIDENVGYKMRICNGVSFVDVGKKNKTPMRTPEQANLVRKMIVDYNGKMSADYENIEAILIDSGAGGGGVNIADYFMEEWKSPQGVTHKGLIDPIESSDYLSKFPNAVQKLRLVNPKKYKLAIYDALIDMMNLDLISFTADYDMRGFITVLDKNKNESQYKLSFDEELALKNIDLAKEELVNIYRYEGTNKSYRYDLALEKANKMHDDRAYCLAMLAFYLQEIRRKHITGKTKKNTDWSKFIKY
jgi:hypothetical protein